MQKVYDRDSSEIEALTTLPVHDISRGAKVLDVGCATGFYGNFLFNEKECTVVGIDISEKALAQAKEKNCYEKLYCLNLNNYKDELVEYEGVFDCILMGDVLEHLINPEEILQKFKKLLNKDGFFVISIPNIAHGSIKLNLLKNRFMYTDTGLLDNTHIRFFTLNNIIDLMNKQNLEIKNLKRVYVDIYSSEQNINRLEFSWIIKNHIGADPESFVYQYVVMAKPVQEVVSNKNKQFFVLNAEDKKEYENFKKSIQLPLKRRFIRPIEEFIKYRFKK